MHYSTIVLAFAALAAAAPGSMTARSPNTKTGILRRQTSELCGTDTPLCCEVDVEGVADLDCTRPTGSPSNTTEFISECSAIGKTAECCLLDVDGISLICDSA